MSSNAKHAYRKIDSGPMRHLFDPELTPLPLCLRDAGSAQTPNAAPRKVSQVVLSGEFFNKIRQTKTFGITAEYSDTVNVKGEGTLYRVAHYFAVGGACRARRGA